MLSDPGIFLTTDNVKHGDVYMRTTSCLLPSKKLYYIGHIDTIKKNSETYEYVTTNRQTGIGVQKAVAKLFGINIRGDDESWAKPGVYKYLTDRVNDMLINTFKPDFTKDCIPKHIKRYFYKGKKTMSVWVVEMILYDEENVPYAVKMHRWCYDKDGNFVSNKSSSYTNGFKILNRPE